MKNKTIIQGIFERNRGLSKTISEHTIKRGSKPTLHPETIRKAVRGEKVNFDTKFEIFASLLDLKIFRFGEYTINELFDNK